MTPPDDTPEKPARVTGSGRDIARTLDPDYEAILAAVTETARGRWFLDEYARRNRTADTRALLKALHRIEQAIPSVSAAPASDEVLDRVKGLVEQAARARVEIAAVPRYDAEGPVRRSAEEIDFLTESEPGKAAILQAHEAAERIQEIVWNLREREVSAELCDTVDRHAAEIQAACRTGTATLKGMNAMGRALRHLELQAAELAEAASKKTARSADTEPDIFGGDLAAKRFLEEIDVVDVVDVVDVEWDVEDVGDAEEERARRARAEALPQPPSDIDFGEEPIADTTPEPAEPLPVGEAAGAVEAEKPQIPVNAEIAPAAAAPGARAEAKVVKSVPGQQALKPPDRSEKPADLTGLTFDQKMILFS